MKLIKDFGVRALFGVIILVPAVATLCYLALDGSREALIAIVAASSSIVSFYFGQRSKEKKEEY